MRKTEKTDLTWTKKPKWNVAPEWATHLCFPLAGSHLHPGKWYWVAEPDEGELGRTQVLNARPRPKKDVPEAS